MMMSQEVCICSVQQTHPPMILQSHIQRRKQRIRPEQHQKQVAPELQPKHHRSRQARPKQQQKRLRVHATPTHADMASVNQLLEPYIISATVTRDSDIMARGVSESYRMNVTLEPIIVQAWSNVWWMGKRVGCFALV